MTKTASFLSDNAARVHPQIWAALQRADDSDVPYDNDAHSRMMDERFSAVFGRPAYALWAATGTAANCLALSTMVPPYGGVICHASAHIENDEGGAPGFFLHGAKLMPIGGEGAKINPESIAAMIGEIRADVHRVLPHAISITQASELGMVYRADELHALGELARARNLSLHMDGARFANAAAFLGANAAEAAGPIDALSFGMVKNGAMNAEAIIFFDEDKANLARHYRKRSGHLQSKGRFLAAQILAMLDGDLWLQNARAANSAAAEIASAAHARLLHPVEANEVFITCTRAEREALRARGFAFYDWGEHAARFVTAWDSNVDAVHALSKTLSTL